MAVAPIAPEAGAALGALFYALAGFTAIVGYVVVRGLLASWTHSIGFMLQWLKSELSFTIHVSFVHTTVDLGGPFGAVDNLVVSALQSWAQGLEAEAGYFFHGSTSMLDWLAGQVQGLADDTADTFDWLINHHIPKFGKYVLPAALLLPNLIRLIDQEIHRLVPPAEKLAHAAEHIVKPEVIRITRYIGATAIPSPWAIPRFRDWAHDLSRWRELTNRRVGRLEKILGIGGLAALITATFGAEITRFLRCKNTRGIAKSWCGADLSGLLGLLAGIVAITEGVSLLDFAEAMVAVEDLVVQGILDGLSEFQGVSL